MSNLQPLILRKRDELVLSVFDESNNTCTELHSNEQEQWCQDEVNTTKLITSYKGDYRECDVCFHPTSPIHFAHASTTTLHYSVIVELPHSREPQASRHTNNDKESEANQIAASGVEAEAEAATATTRTWRMLTVFSTPMPHVVIDLCFSSKGKYLVTYAQMDPKRTINGNLMIFAVPEVTDCYFSSSYSKNSNNSNLNQVSAQCLAQFKQVRWPALCWSSDESLLVRSVVGQLHVLNGNLSNNKLSNSNMEQNAAEENNISTMADDADLTTTTTNINNVNNDNNDNNDSDKLDKENGSDTKTKKSSSISCLDLCLPTNKEIVFSTAPAVSQVAFGASSAPLLALFKPFHKQRQSTFTLYRLPYIGHHENELIHFNFGKAEQAQMKWSASGKYIALMVESEKNGAHQTNSYYAPVRLYLVDIANRRVEEIKLDSLSVQSQSAGKSGNSSTQSNTSPSFKTVGKGARLADLPLKSSSSVLTSSSSSTAVSKPSEAVHECQWNPVKDELLIIHGVMPRNKATLLDVKTKTIVAKFNEAPRNTALWSGNGQLLLLGGSGNLAGDYQIYYIPTQDKNSSCETNATNTKLSGAGAYVTNTQTSENAVKCSGEFNEKCSVELWSPNGYHLLCATLFTKLRMGNKVVFFKSNGVRLLTIKFDELYGVHWIQLMPRDAYSLRPPSPRYAKSITNVTSNNKKNDQEQVKRLNNATSEEQQQEPEHATDEQAAETVTKPKIYVPPGGHSRAALLLRRTNDNANVNEANVNTSAGGDAKKVSGPVGGTVVVTNKKKGKGKKH